MNGPRGEPFAEALVLRMAHKHPTWGLQPQRDTTYGVRQDQAGIGVHQMDPIKGIPNNYISEGTGGWYRMSTNHLCRPGRRSTWASTAAIASVVSLTPVW